MADRSGDRARGRAAKASVLRSVAAWGYLTGGALLLVGATLVALHVVDRTVYDPRVDRALRATSALRRAHEAMLDQQVGLRGFLLSGDARFLEAYERGREELPVRNAEWSRALSGDAGLGDDLIEIRLAQ